MKSPSLVLLLFLFLAMNFLSLQIKTGISYFRKTPQLRLSLCQSSILIVNQQDGGQVALNTGSMLGHVQTQSPMPSYNEGDFIKQEKFWSLWPQKENMSVCLYSSMAKSIICGMRGLGWMKSALSCIHMLESAGNTLQF